MTAKVTGDEIVRYFDRNLEVLKKVLSCAERSAENPQDGGEGQNQHADETEVFL